MKRQTRKFEIKFNRSKNKIERVGVRLFKSMFRDIYKQYIDAVLSRPVSMWIESTEMVKQQQVEDVFVKYYQMHYPLAMMVRKNLLSQKSDIEDQMWENVYRDKMKSIALTQAGEKIVSVTNTTKEQLKKIVGGLIEEADAEGWGIDKIQKQLLKELGGDLRGNATARARAIAQTEMISASNQAANTAANSTGFETRKFWSTSGLGGVRETHIEAENYSDSVGGLKENETFPNGLLYPGDPSGDASEVVNCRCSILHEIV